jgi:hypothetical protein
MTQPRFNLPKENTSIMATEQTGIRALVGRKMTKPVKFMGADVNISKLSVAQVLEIQNRAKGIEADDNEGFNVLKTVIRASVEGASDLTDQDFENFPLDELSKLSNDIMKFSGIGSDAGK